VIQSFLSKEFLGFLITGGIAATVNFVSRIYFNQFYSFSASVVFAYLLGMLTAFILARVFVFNKSSQPIWRSVVIFSLVNVLALTQTWFISMGLNYYVLPSLGIERFVPEISSAIGIIFPVFTSYLGHKYWSFK